MGTDALPKQRDRAVQILDELEAGIGEAGTETAWYGFIGLDDVRWALRTIAGEGSDDA